MTTNLIIQLSVISTNQLFSTLDKSESSLELETIYLTQHYRANPEVMNTIPIPVCADNSPKLPLPTVDIKQRYQVLSNHHIFSARQKAQCPLALCLRLNKPEQNPNLWQAELQHKKQKVKFNIAAIGSDDLKQVFHCLSKNVKGLTRLLKRMDLVQAVVEHPGRPYWSSWKSITALAKSRKVLITPKHMNCLEGYFYFDPQPLSKQCINIVSAQELKEYLRILPLEEEVISQLSDLLSNSPSRRHWRNSKDIINSLGAEKVSMIRKYKNYLASYFYFDPQPLPKRCINTISAEELREHLGILPLEKKVVDQLSHMLSNSPSRRYWQNSNDIVKALRAENQQPAIPKPTKTMLDQSFKFTSAPPPVPNTIVFLLSIMNKKKLQDEAKERGLVYKGMRKEDLVHLLSSS